MNIDIVRDSFDLGVRVAGIVPSDMIAVSLDRPQRLCYGVKYWPLLAGGNISRRLTTGSHSNLGTGRYRHHGQSASTKAKGVRHAIEGAGCRLLYLFPYSPDFNPIEKAFAKLKAALRAKVEGLWNTVG